jgi:hypothetical protein
MRRIWFVIPVVALGMAGPSLYRTFLRPVDPLQPNVVALAQHFERSGLNVRPYAVPHGFSHSEVTAAAVFEITGFPLEISVDQCPSAQAAELHLDAIAHSPNLTHPLRNGNLVMYLPMWGDDTQREARRIEDIFRSFSQGT